MSMTAEIQALLVKAVAAQQQGALDDAGAAYRAVLALDPDQFDALNLLGVVAAQQNDLAGAAALMERATQVNPHHAGAHYNLGYVYEDLRQYEAAAASYGRAATLKPDHVLAHNNRGLALAALKRLEEAIASFDAALAIDPDNADVWQNRATIASEAGRLEEAHANFETARRLRPDLAFMEGTRLFTKARLCDWRDRAEDVAALAAAVTAGAPVTPPWPILSLVDSQELHHRAAQIWTRAKHPAVAAAPPLPAPHDRIRVGYFSPDFRDHPVATLMAGVFESHDRAAFACTAFSFGPITGDAMQHRLQRAFERFIDVSGKSDGEVVAIARGLGIDIAVDLAGYTSDSRAGIFAARAAPVQINYLGFPGSMGAAFMDYIIADRMLISPDTRPHFAEHVISLPSYQANDQSRAFAARRFTRTELELPENGVVFCAFASANKINPAGFAGWMRILAAVENSVLWLSHHSAAAAGNLRAAATAAGIATERLIFAARLGPEEHLARQSVADLFLDTFPFTAASSASDALWAGVPVVTRAGESYVARVAASLLTAAGLPEMITTSQDAFEALAIGLAKDPPRLSALRARLAQAATSSRLFDTRSFTHTLEEAYTRIHARARAGMPPADLVIGET
jgi:predicted O-linked N-acetylglucosamine transferase (SPINDLY family)